MDGAFFGTTFPHLLLMTFPAMRPQRPADRYTPRVFGFRLHQSALACGGDAPRAGTPLDGAPAPRVRALDPLDI